MARMSAGPLRVLSVALVVALVPEAAVAHCFEHDAQYLPRMEGGAAVKTVNAGLCQKHCAQVPGCAYFTFFHANDDCFVSGSDAVKETVSDGMSGPMACPTTVSTPNTGDQTIAEKAQVEGVDDSLISNCKVRPGPGFPGNSNSQSNLAWPSGTQPESLDCWPKQPNGDPGQCWKVSLLLSTEDTDMTWPGLCQDLDEVRNIPVNMTCEDACSHTPTCPAFQVAEDGKCYMGDGYKCYEGPAPFRIAEAGRWQHGEVWVFMPQLTNIRIMNLQNAFAANLAYFQNNEAGAVQACKIQCYSDITCQYWQYSSESGCWVEDQTRSKVEYPLKLIDRMRQVGRDEDAAFVATLKGGEYIQHVCPMEQLYQNYPTITWITVAPKTEATQQGIDWWWWLLMAFLGILLLAAIVGAFMYLKKDGKEKKKRGMVPKPRAAPVEPMPMVVVEEEVIQPLIEEVVVQPMQFPQSAAYTQYPQQYAQPTYTTMVQPTYASQATYAPQYASAPYAAAPTYQSMTAAPTYTALSAAPPAYGAPYTAPFGSRAF